MRRAGWRIGNRIRRFPFRDHKTEDGKFVYFLSRSRPVGFQSRLRSPPVALTPGSCLNFWIALGGTKISFPEGNSMLKLYMAEKGASIEGQMPIWSKADGFSQVTEFQKVVVPLDRRILAEKNLKVQFVFETIGGASRKGVVAIDDVELRSCAGNTINERNAADFGPVVGPGNQMQEAEKILLDIMLPARRSPVESISFENLTSGSPVNPSNGMGVLSIIPASEAGEFVVQEQTTKPELKRKLRQKRKKGRKGRKGKKGKKIRNRQRKNRKNFVVHTRDPLLSLPRSVLPPTTMSARAMCDFLEYTQRLGRCLRDFFETLQLRPKRCKKQYVELEWCLQNAAISCVPAQDMDTLRVKNLITEALRDRLQTKKVFCEEDGAFVYPQFAVDQLPIQCGARYFMKLNECSSSFSAMFHFQHGDPKLCRVYYKANQCQRQATAEECNFDVETMILYGLNLQYQITHNPFCLNMPFSSWWIET